MSPADTLKMARAAGIEFRIDGDDLLLEAPAPPPAAVFELLLRHKVEIVRRLRAGCDSRPAHDRQVFFDERAGMPAPLESTRRDPDARHNPAEDHERRSTQSSGAVVRLRLLLEAEDGRRCEALLAIPRARYDGSRVLELFEQYRMAGTTRVVGVSETQ